MSEIKKLKIKYKDIFGNEIKKEYCKDCNTEISGITHHKKGFCLRKILCN